MALLTLQEVIQSNENIFVKLKVINYQVLTNQYLCQQLSENLALI